MISTIFDTNINSIKTIVLHYYNSITGFTEIKTDPITLFKKIKSDDFKYKDISVHKMELFDENDHLLSFALRFPYISLVEYFSKRIFLDCNLESLHEGDPVEFINSGKKGIVNRLGVGTTKKLVSIMVENHVYTVLPKNIRKIHQDKLNEEKAEKIDLLNAPYFIKIDIDGRYYSYACFDEVKVDDYVMVSGRAEAMIHKVREVIPNHKMTNKNIVTQEVKCVCHFDFSAYEDRKMKRHDQKIINEFNNVLKNVTTMSEIEVLENILNNKKQELQNI